MNAASFTKNWKFAESYMPLIVDILQKNAMYIVKVEAAAPEEDMKECTDLKITVKSGDVAVRIRRSSIQYRDLTIRAYKNGHETEIHKLRKGFGDWYLYVWTDDCGGFDNWILVDINVMRRAGLFAEDRMVIMNKDKTSGFVIYGIPELIKIGALVAWKE